MARFARVIAAGVPHHITQRGNSRRFILESETDRNVYLDLLRQSMEQHEIRLIGYCLMSNHIHLIAIPERAEALALALKDTHGRFACYWNAIHSSSGHVWQGRYYSCPLDEPHLWEALRYTELNPVRACLTARAECWQWSSAAAHCGATTAAEWLHTELWRNRWPADAWRSYLAAGESESRLAAIRRNTHTGRPLGSAEFVCELEMRAQRSLAPQKRGPKSKRPQGENQGTLSFST
jgi:putative transposase